jgi:peptide/nickel transport system substrate-binding protein
MRKYYWYISAFVKKHGTLVLASIVVAILLFSAVFPTLTRIFEAKKRTYIGVVGRYSLNSLPRSIQEEISRGLTKIEKDGTAVPDIAERWGIQDDGKTYRFIVKKNLQWQDGTDVTPFDLQFSLSNVEIEHQNNEVIFRLEKPYAAFPIVASEPLFKIVSEPYLIFFRRPQLIGLGKSKVLSYKERGQKLDEIVIGNETEEKIYRFYLTEDDAIDGFKRGEVDSLPNFSSVGDLKDWKTVDIQPKLDKRSYLGIFFNLDNKNLNSNELRQALNYALTKPSDESRAVGPISPESWAFADVGKSYDKDEERAVERFKSFIPTLADGRLEIELVTLPSYVQEAEEIKKEWEAFGEKVAAACMTDSKIKEKNLCENSKMKVNVSIDNFPDTTDFQALLLGQEIPYDPDQYSLWHSGQSTNFTHYENTRIDSILQKARQVEDRSQRIELYQNFQQFFSEDAPVIFIKHLYKYDVRRK